MLEQRPSDVFDKRPAIDGAPLLPGNGNGELFSGNSLSAHRHHEAARAIMSAAIVPKDEHELTALKKARDEEARRQTKETQDRIWAATQRVSEVMKLEEEAQRQRLAEV